MAPIPLPSPGADVGRLYRRHRLPAKAVSAFFMSPAKITPMMQQYFSIKEQYPDSILFYRMGDFYEMFFEDAERASPLLEIALTSRNKKDDVPVPMCGVPYRAAQGYIARLLEHGLKVAICDQVEDPAKARGLVKRDVVRVISPGMIFESELLDSRSHNFLLAFIQCKDAAGLAYLDISTGTFRLLETAGGAAAVEEAVRVAAAEVLLPASAAQDPAYAALRTALEGRALSYLEDRWFDYRQGRRRLLKLFHVHSLEGFGCEGLRAGVAAAGALVGYMAESQKQPVDHFTGIETYSLDGHLQIDESSCRNLELLRNIQTGSRRGTLLAVLDATVTAMGGRMLKHWLRYPLRDFKSIEARLDAVQEGMEQADRRRQARQMLGDLADLERLGSRIVMGQGNARDLMALGRSLQNLPDLGATVAGLNAPLLRPEIAPQEFDELATLIAAAIRDDAPPTIGEGGMIREGFDPELDRLIRRSREGKTWLLDLERRERETTGIATLKVRYNKVFGYYLEVPKSRADHVPEHYIRKQTLVNAERYITEELKSFEADVLNSEERRAALERRLFEQVSQAAAARNGRVQQAAGDIARLDCLLGLAETAARSGYRRPKLNAQGCIEISDGRHPVVEKMIPGERFVPNSIALDDEHNQILVITGPNMAGKSTVLRQVALAVVMTQMGSFVPAGKAEVSLTDRIFTRVGALDNLSQGQSTFMVEMQETANILNHASPQSLILLDEIGRGTSTFDGLSIAWAVAEHLHDLHGRGVKTLFATHYHELTELAGIKERVQNYNIAVKEWNEEIIFLRKLVPGGTNRSYGIQVARLAGIPPAVIQRAKKILLDIEREDGGGLPIRAPGPNGPPGRPQPVQLQMFTPPGNDLLRKLCQLDLTIMTPLEALNCLNELQEKARSAIG